MSVDTIFAPATASGRAALAIIRVSGPKSVEVLQGMSGISDWAERRPRLCILKNRDNQALDEVVATVYRGPRSYTGEDLVEICCHGNPRIVETLMREMVSRETRPALAGEFTRRALANAKLSIDQVESLDAILNSNHERLLSRAIRSKIEGLSGTAGRLSAQTLDLMVSVQSQLDFSENEVGAVDLEVIKAQLRSLIETLRHWIRDFDIHRPLMQKRVVVLMGPPNSGKSTLFNRMVGFERSIVFDAPGTTRDLIDYDLEANGVSLRLVDTAGLRDSEHAIERLGIERSRDAAARADLILWCSDNYTPPTSIGGLKNSTAEVLWVHTKADLSSQPQPEWLEVSAQSGHGIQNLMQRLISKPEEVEEMASLPGLTSERQRDHADRALRYLESAHRGLEEGLFLDQIAEEAKGAELALREICGGVPNSEVLAAILSRFCIGK